MLRLTMGDDGDAGDEDDIDVEVGILVLRTPAVYSAVVVYF